MTIEKFRKEFQMEQCIKNCGLKNKIDENNALIKPQKKIKGVVISQDPPFSWLKKYKDNIDNHVILFEKGIPQKLMDRISYFMEDEIGEKDIDRMISLYYNHTYWTHLHKCFTGKHKNKNYKYSYKNARICADTWLIKELEILINKHKIEFIIALGNDVQKWICEWREDYCTDKNVHFFYLPHPSPANVGSISSWNPECENRDKIKMRVEKFLELSNKV